MAEEEDKDWNPHEENETERLARENLLLGNQFLKDMTAEAEKRRIQEEKAKEASARAKEELGSIATRAQRLTAYSQPTFEEISARIAKCWAEVKKLVPDAPPHIQGECFHHLMTSAYNSCVLEGPPVEG